LGARPKVQIQERFREMMMRATRILTAAVFASVAAYGVTYAAERMPGEVKVHDGMLTDAKGMTLYTWDNDKEANKSSCNGMCLMNWPELKASATDRDVGEFKVITRDDGSKQWSYKGKPLYHFRMDAAAGDTKGEGRGMVWHIAKM
jgi:predicted lipoprotein with Yx(FWY)xxD motif